MTEGIDLSWVWAIGFITFGFGIACGVVIGYLNFGNSRRSEELQEKLDAMEQEFDRYRGQVGSHFQRTSELVQQMTHSYREVYEHLASGSQALCQDPVTTPRLDIPETPSLESGQPQHTGPANDKPAPAATDTSLEDENESDAVMGDAPHVPSLESGDNETTTSTPRTPSH